MAYECVVIGASLGGLEAVATLLRSLGPEFSAPIAISQHRAAASSDGDLSAIWQRSTSLAIRDAEDKEGLERHRVYVAPADYHLLVESREQLALSTDPPVLYARPSIDVLFESAADAFGVALIGVVLTGASQDGARGAARIQDRGGIVIVQDPASAERPEMPAAALAAAPMSQVQPLEQIASTLLRMGGHVLPGTP